MQWSKVKHTIETDRFADSVKKRVRLNATNYRARYEDEGRFWITFDQTELINCCDFSSYFVHNDYFHVSTRSWCLSHASPPPEERTPGALVEKGEFSKRDALRVLFRYIELSIEEALSDPSPIVNGMAMLDRRLGKRRLEKMEGTFYHPFVEGMFAIRMQCESEKAIALK